MYERMSAHTWALRATVGRRVTGPNELAWVEQALAALAGQPLNGGQMMDVIVVLTGQIRALAEQTASTSEEESERESVTAILCRTSSSRR